jgi:hypothetical protein
MGKTLNQILCSKQFEPPPIPKNMRSIFCLFFLEITSTRDIIQRQAQLLIGLHFFSLNSPLTVLYYLHDIRHNLIFLMEI